MGILSNIIKKTQPSPSGRLKLVSRRSAFTIVELLVVIVVIAILAAISIVAYTGIQRSVAETAIKSDLRNGATELGLAHAETGNYPGTDGQTTDGDSLKKSPGTTFQYTPSGNEQDFCLTATSSREGVPAFHVSNTSGITEGTCPGHTGPSTGGGGGGGSIANNSPIQDVTSAQCAALPTFTGSNEDAIRTVTDNRGGSTRSYRIAKLADNKCWMLDNLKLGSTTNTITLTPSDSNVASNFTLPQLITSGSLSSDNPQAIGPVPGDTGSGTTNYGYLYNWSAATAGESRITAPAGSGNAPHSICASGWRLPIGGTSSGDFRQLDQAFGGIGGSSHSHWQASGAFQGAFAGYWYGSFVGPGSLGLWWSSSAAPSDADSAFGAYVELDYVNPGDDYYARRSGFGVRCLLN